MTSRSHNCWGYIKKKYNTSWWYLFYYSVVCRNSVLVHPREQKLLILRKKKDQLYTVLLIKNTNGDRPDQTTPSDSINKLGLVFNTLKSYIISDTSKRYESKF